LERNYTYNTKLFIKIYLVLFFVLISFFIFYNINNKKLFNDSFSTVIVDKDSILLGAYVAGDGQWRFPEIKVVPYKFEQAILTFEDKRFYYHNGIDPLAILRAIKLDLKNKKIVSGGSTITMQLERIAHKNKKRTFFAKIIEMFAAINLELTHSKKEILALYASHAPFGGNVVGLNAASYRYFGVYPKQLTWAESCLLAVLPNSPSLIRLSKNRDILLKKRNNLLKKLKNRKIITTEEYNLALLEKLPDKLFKNSDIAYHLCKGNFFKSNKIINKSNIDYYLQIKVNNIAEKYIKRYSQNRINNASVIVAEVNTGRVLAYVGNVKSPNINNDFYVDIAQSKRSTGSILKPFLYCSLINSGDITPRSLIYDIPTHYNGYAPKNFNLDYSGAVPANKALARSLNIPAVRMLKMFGIEKFMNNLKKLGMTTLDKSSDYYGLSLILGGAEGKLYDITSMYASLARVLNDYNKTGQAKQNDIFPLQLSGDFNKYDNNDNFELLSPASIYLMFEAMLDVKRPNEEKNWEYFSSTQKIAWKTGTSFGFKDAWAIGITTKYIVGVWVGNANGEGRPGLTGIKAAAPILFDIFDILPKNYNWFKKPVNDMKEINICKKSGYLASRICNETEKILIPKNANNTNICKFHKLIDIDKNGFRVNDKCEKISNIKTVSWFVLPPTVEYYYKKRHSDYKPLPPVRSDCMCVFDENIKKIDIIYPKNLTEIYIPKEIDGKKGDVIFEAVHRNNNAELFWFIDGNFICKTKYFHHIAVKPEIGEHILTILDKNGEKITRKFKILNK